LAGKRLVGHQERVGVEQGEQDRELERKAHMALLEEYMPNQVYVAINFVLEEAVSSGRPWDHRNVSLLLSADAFGPSPNSI
jgi:hypothetical protein